MIKHIFILVIGVVGEREGAESFFDFFFHFTTDLNFAVSDISIRLSRQTNFRFLVPGWGNVAA